jgi:alpha-L-rhamnosidase
MRAAALRCEHREDVPCLDEAIPRLTWALESAGRDKRQTAYRILVAESPEHLAAEYGSLWDSGHVPSATSVDIAYAGRPLPPATECWWAVQVWDEAGQAGPWSDAARFRTGLAEWHADWIFRDDSDDPGMEIPGEDPEKEADRQLVLANPAPHLRRRFQTSGPVRRAMLYATARGVVELQINGVRVGDSLLAPGWTDYRRRIEYAAYDVTGLLRQGENVLAAILGDGWYAGFVGFDARRAGAHYGEHPELLCELHVEHVGGGVHVVASDAEWRGSTGPIRYSDLLHGEYYDGRRELTGWSEPGYDDDAWLPVKARARDEVLLVPERGQPIRVTEEVRSVSIGEPHPGVHVFDLGQNIVGWARLVVQGKRGTRVRLRFAEMLEPDGSLYLDNLRSARPIETYVLRGGGEEVYEPRFTFHGFRYVEVTGLPDPPTLDTITGRVVHSDTPWTGRFDCSDEMVNQLWRNITWGQRGNFISVPTDCPQRDERLGWLADAQVFLPTAAYNMDVAAFMTKWGDDVLDGQSPEGAYPDVAPRLVLDRDGAPGWADGAIIVPWTLYRRYGDVRILKRHWDAMERYMAHLVLQNPDLLWTTHRNNDYGDWLSVGAETPREVLGTAYFAHDATLMARIADVLGKPAGAVHYQRLRRAIVAAFDRAYVGDDARIEGDTQTVYLLALHMDLLPDALRARAAERLVADIERHDGHLTTGFLGVGLLCPVLSEAGYSDVAHRLLLTDSFPSWGYSIRHGATTIWERWDGWTEEHGFQTPLMNSFNHYSLGSVGQWLYEYVAGIRCHPEHPGYAHVVIAPEPGELEHASATYRSVRGPISSAWRQSDTAFELDLDIPANVSATIVLPCGGSRLIEGETEASCAIGVRSAVRDDRGWTVELGSGRYAFSMPLQQRAPARVSASS